MQTIPTKTPSVKKPIAVFLVGFTALLAVALGLASLK